MKTSEFFGILKDHQGKSLLFEYLPGSIVPANYHITEVKHVSIDSVDCGANSDSWKETVIQLWESPSEAGKTEFMTVYKALSILKKVGRMKPYDLDSEVKIEYSNDNFHTAQLFVDDFEISDRNLTLKLAINKTDCKAKETCGVPETAVTSSQETCCAPGSDCC